MVDDEECLFCRIVDNKEPADIILDDDNYISFYNRFTRHNGHAIVIPKEDVCRVKDVKDMLSYTEFIYKVHNLILELYEPLYAEVKIEDGDKYKGNANHVHCHIIPYYDS